MFSKKFQINRTKNLHAVIIYARGGGRGEVSWSPPHPQTQGVIKVEPNFEFGPMWYTKMGVPKQQTTNSIHHGNIFFLQTELNPGLLFFLLNVSCFLKVSGLKASIYFNNQNRYEIWFITLDLFSHNFFLAYFQKCLFVYNFKLDESHNLLLRKINS